MGSLGDSKDNALCEGFFSTLEYQFLDQATFTISCVAVPKKRKLSDARGQRETALHVLRLRRQHASVESASNASKIHGLNRYPDHGFEDNPSRATTYQMGQMGRSPPLAQSPRDRFSGD